MTDQNNKDDKHKARQKKVKAQVDKKVADAQIEKGILQVITGNGKGKSTSGFGTVTRCVGHGMRAGVVQFIKGNWDCGERTVLEKLSVPFAVMKTGFTWDTQDKTADTLAAQKTWQEAKVMLADPTFDLVLLDEITYMATYGYIELDEIINVLENRPKMQNVIITGRGAHRRLTDLADIVSEVKNIKHAFDAGVKAQKGFDY